MAWQETRVLDERLSFISEVLEGVYSMSEGWRFLVNGEKMAGRHEDGIERHRRQMQ
jgi:hypothetical protein